MGAGCYMGTWHLPLSHSCFLVCTCLPSTRSPSPPASLNALTQPHRLSSGCWRHAGEPSSLQKQQIHLSLLFFSMSQPQAICHSNRKWTETSENSFSVINPNQCERMVFREEMVTHNVTTLRTYSVPGCWA